jgi:hypothetical protein
MNPAAQMAVVPAYHQQRRRRGDLSDVVEELSGEGDAHLSGERTPRRAMSLEDGESLVSGRPDSAQQKALGAVLAVRGCVLEDGAERAFINVNPLGFREGARTGSARAWTDLENACPPKPSGVTDSSERTCAGRLGGRNLPGSRGRERYPFPIWQTPL